MAATEITTAVAEDNNGDKNSLSTAMGTTMVEDNNDANGNNNSLSLRFEATICLHYKTNSVENKARTCDWFARGNDKGLQGEVTKATICLQQRFAQASIVPLMGFIFSAAEIFC
ncbi:hypothetical protein AMTR_s00112p00104810 [Amborella trichopoda]|uniref:Uncharacterized protein n=1 Tax=Amborella trichopoda TaxID=13333 RepID=W1NXP9_AMBTC|nr:hypothetical protein AMTR_s00112p00104810 [Amborella trichopoda]